MTNVRGCVVVTLVIIAVCVLCTVLQAKKPLIQRWHNNMNATSGLMTALKEKDRQIADLQRRLAGQAVRQPSTTAHDLGKLAAVPRVVSQPNSKETIIAGKETALCPGVLAHEYRSQHEEDTFLWGNMYGRVAATMAGGAKQFPMAVCTGRVLEVGAHDGYSISNSWFLRKIGWSSICVEPNIAKFSNITNCTHKHNAILSDGNTEKMYLRNSGSSATRTVTRRARKGFVGVRATTLSAVLAEADWDWVDWMSIDVEAHEESLLRGMNWTVRVGVWTIEDSTHDCRGIWIRAMLSMHGYILIESHEQNLWFVNSTVFHTYQLKAASPSPWRFGIPWVQYLDYCKLTPQLLTWVWDKTQLDMEHVGR
eukprot:TRINITY_DN66279_c6_g2_i1.p1 TRINITY_DN66279_c6_g2~~TRINITY_DN66279_c6_g2_i1.p1  ORF type:complete len:366 (+),score=34.36 TRINITY_DN66279_c6_g2_i1:81-1178(+)